MSNRKKEPSLNEWEAKFTDGAIANSRNRADNRWLSGCVYVVRGLTDRLEPVETGGLPFHKVIAHPTSAHVTESVANAKPHLDRTFSPGDVHVVSKELAEQETRITWQTVDQQSCEIVTLLLEPSQLAAAARALNLDYSSTEFIPCAAKSDPLLYELAYALGAELALGNSTNRLYAEQLMQSVAIHLVAKYSTALPAVRQYRDELPSNRMRLVEEYVRSHLNQSLSLKDLAAQVSLSAYYFAHQFKAAVGESPAAFVRRLRMEEAARLLRDRPDRTIAAIAAEVGYADPASFAKAFRRQTGISPSRYRQANQ